VKVFDADKTRMIGLLYGDKTDDMLSRFHLNSDTGTLRTNKRTDGQSKLLCQYRASVC